VEAPGCGNVPRWAMNMDMAVEEERYRTSQPPFRVGPDLDFTDWLLEKFVLSYSQSAAGCGKR
jgi:hypothetical protein